MITDTVLSEEETKELHERILNDEIEPTGIVHERKCSLYYYKIDGRAFELVYTPGGEYFCNIASERKLEKTVDR